MATKISWPQEKKNTVRPLDLEPGTIFKHPNHPDLYIKVQENDSVFHSLIKNATPAINLNTWKLAGLTNSEGCIIYDAELIIK